MAIRGGFGLFRDFLDVEYRSHLINNPPFFSLLNVSNPPFPLGFSGGGTTSVPLTSPDGFDFNLKIATALEYNFSIQRQITTNTIFVIGYAGSHSVHLINVFDANTAVPQILADGSKFYPLGAPARNPNFSKSTYTTGDTHAFYNALQLDLVRRSSRGLRYKASYTFSKNLDDISSTASMRALSEASATQDPENRKADRGLSSYDMRHYLIANFSYALPWNHLAGVGRLVEGWEIGAIASYAGGLPVEVLTGFNRSRNLSGVIADRPNLVAGKSNNPVLGGPDKYFDPTAFTLPPAGTYGNLGRNTVRAPKLVNLDFNLAKAIPINEQWKMDFRAEFFNVFNHANFSFPNNQIFGTNGQILGSAGVITSTVTTSRQIQFGVKLIF